MIKIEEERNPEQEYEDNQPLFPMDTNRLPRGDESCLGSPFGVATDDEELNPLPMPPHSGSALDCHVLRNLYVVVFGDSSLTFDDTSKNGTSIHLTAKNVTGRVEGVVGGYLSDTPVGSAGPAFSPSSRVAGLCQTAHAAGHGVLQHVPIVFCECGVPLKRLVAALRNELKRYDTLYRDKSGVLAENAPEVVGICSYWFNGFTTGDVEPTQRLDGNWTTDRSLCQSIPGWILEPIDEMCALLHMCHYRYAIIGRSAECFGEISETRFDEMVPTIIARFGSTASSVPAERNGC